MVRATFGKIRQLRAALTITATLWTSVAFAQVVPEAVQQQQQPQQQIETAVPEEQPVAPPTEVVTPPPPPPVRSQVQRADEPVQELANDLDPSKRPVGIGYAGISQVPIGGTVGTLTAPAIGARIWTSPKMGVDVALGFGWADGSVSMTGQPSQDMNAVWGLVLQAGLPIALATHRHVSFQVIPYASFAYGQTKSQGPTPITFSGSRFDLGARSGLEIFWGFIGLPQLSLSATVGVAFQRRSISQEQDAGPFNPGGTSTATTYGITTTVQNNPWDIFTGNVAARYYF